MGSLTKRFRNDQQARQGQEHLRDLYNPTDVKERKQATKNPSRTRALRFVRAFQNVHRGRHFDGGRRPIERKRTRAWILNRYREV